jgi:UTP--glucose-1-phosphate uridylyltransferase
MLGDDLVRTAGRPWLGQLLDAHERYGGAVLAVMHVPRELVSRYGIVELEPDAQRGVDERTFRMRRMVEKPPVEEAPSDLAIMGRYVLPPEIFALLEQTRPGSGGEIQLTDAIQALRQQQPIFGYAFEGTRYDTGDPVGLLTTSLAFALDRPDLAPGVKAYLRTLNLN